MPKALRCAAVSLALLLAWASAAHAQSRRYPPRVIDIDADEEQHSEFWSELLFPERQDYEQLLWQASKLRKEDRVREAVAALEQATQADPERPEAYWELVEISSVHSDYPRCIAAALQLRHRFEDYQPDDSRLEPGTLLSRYAGCLHMAGRYEQAITALLELAQRPRRDTYRSQLRLGMAYLALGRLAEAKDALTASLAHRSRHAPARFALALLLRREGRPAEAARELDSALRLDPQARGIVGNRDLGRGSEALQLQAMVAIATGQGALARARLRRFLADPASRPWRRIAESDLRAQLALDEPRDSGWVVTGEGSSGEPAARASRRVVLRERELRPEIDRCLQGSPDLVLRVISGAPLQFAPLEMSRSRSDPELLSIYACLRPLLKSVAVPAPFVRRWTLSFRGASVEAPPRAR